jgi:hypothetical protein
MLSTEKGLKMKTTRIYTGKYKIQATDGAIFFAVVKESGNEWRLYDHNENWIDTFNSLKDCKRWIES